LGAYGTNKENYLGAMGGAFIYRNEKFFLFCSPFLADWYEINFSFRAKKNFFVILRCDGWRLFRYGGAQKFFLVT